MVGSIIFWLAFGYTGCATTSKKPSPRDLEQASGPRMITQIRTAEDLESTRVWISGNAVLTYTSIKQPLPLSVILYFPDTVLQNIQPTYSFHSDTIGPIKTSILKTKKDVAKIEIVLKKDVPYKVIREDSGLKLTFRKASPKDPSAEKPAQPATSQEQAQAAEAAVAIMAPGSPIATHFESVEVKPLQDGVDILIKANGTINKYQAFAVDNPPRIVFDIAGLKSPFVKEQVVAANTVWVKQVRHYGYPDKLRLVLDTEVEYLDGFTSASTANGLLIQVGEHHAQQQAQAARQPVTRILSANAAGASPAIADFAMITANRLNVRPQPDLKSPPLTTLSKGTKVKVLNRGREWLKIEHQNIVGFVRNQKNYVQLLPTGLLPQDQKTAWVNRVDFVSEDKGQSSLIIGTTRTVKYDLQKITARKLQLKLWQTRIPAYRRRPLITTRFESAVDRITPIQRPAMQNEAIIAIELREQVPYLVEQTANLIMIHFDASAIPPRPFEQAGLVPWTEITPLAPAAAETSTTEAPKPKSTRYYSGEKIALDFYETDIKNVFRILKEVSGKNFAVDPNVTGKVTLTLEKPVPWDQVLDLILKMNQLGKVAEGDIIRIATLQTLQKDKLTRRAELKAVQETKHQKTALEPLVTEYIPANYSNAKSDILPHLEDIRTKERGTLSVDERTNLIIMTDVAEKIRQAKEIVKRLDRVTPQVIIEARVVEATTNFSRQLGVQWGGAFGVNPTDQVPTSLGSWAADQTDARVGVGPQDGRSLLGGTYGYNVGFNFPVAAASLGAFGINFANLGGMPLLLNAKLQAMESSGDGRIISAPKIVTLDNREATITQGRKFFINVLDASGNAVPTPQNVELVLKVTPHVTPDNRILMSINISKEDLGPLVSGNPSILSKSAETELLVNDGDTVVIGGIIKTTEDLSRSRVPGLAKIPLLGWLFRSKTKSDNREELLIFITPKIVQLAKRE